ncbi:hypothetical protein THAOC_05974 [Thalassiosira oceanica]|uniref:Uncharacterized protein n=1 Tax=Thalassiosira oceanica TaxID=159749 RepID=K0TFU8_THAOC|nr:hypothetical protein THAOC_05974 [Thalassiosira oceanica]|eukprot:EJK72491.1 hypothetical protein THAOC_05974 [Thalassiosira oceanica]
MNRDILKRVNPGLPCEGSIGGAASPFAGVSNPYVMGDSDRYPNESERTNEQVRTAAVATSRYEQLRSLQQGKKARGHRAKEEDGSLCGLDWLREGPATPSGSGTSSSVPGRAIAALSGQRAEAH